MPPLTRVHVREHVVDIALERRAPHRAEEEPLGRRVVLDGDADEVGVPRHVLHGRVRPLLRLARPGQPPAQHDLGERRADAGGVVRPVKQVEQLAPQDDAPGPLGPQRLEGLDRARERARLRVVDRAQPVGEGLARPVLLEPVDDRAGVEQPARPDHLAVRDRRLAAARKSGRDRVELGGPRGRHEGDRLGTERTLVPADVGEEHPPQAIGRRVVDEQRARRLVESHRDGRVRAVHRVEDEDDGDACAQEGAGGGGVGDEGAHREAVRLEPVDDAPVGGPVVRQRVGEGLGVEVRAEARRRGGDARREARVAPLEHRLEGQAHRRRLGVPVEVLRDGAEEARVESPDLGADASTVAEELRGVEAPLRDPALDHPVGERRQRGEPVAQRERASRETLALGRLWRALGHGAQVVLTEREHLERLPDLGDLEDALRRLVDAPEPRERAAEGLRGPRRARVLVPGGLGGPERVEPAVFHEEHVRPTGMDPSPLDAERQRALDERVRGVEVAHHRVQTRAFREPRRVPPRVPRAEVGPALEAPNLREDAAPPRIAVRRVVAHERVVRRARRRDPHQAGAEPMAPEPPREPCRVDQRARVERVDELGPAPGVPRLGVDVEESMPVVETEQPVDVGRVELHDPGRPVRQGAAGYPRGRARRPPTRSARTTGRPRRTWPSRAPAPRRPTRLTARDSCDSLARHAGETPS